MGKKDFYCEVHETSDYMAVDEWGVPYCRWCKKAEWRNKIKEDVNMGRKKKRGRPPKKKTIHRATNELPIRKKPPIQPYKPNPNEARVCKTCGGRASAITIKVGTRTRSINRFFCEGCDDITEIEIIQLKPMKVIITEECYNIIAAVAEEYDIPMSRAVERLLTRKEGEQ